MDMIYLDHAAATPLYPEVKQALEAILDQDLGNPSSIHQWGQEAKQLIDEARYDIAQEFRASLDGVIFTSGATESAHLAIVGGYLGLNKPTPGLTQVNHKPTPRASLVREGRILVSPLVHKCVWSAVGFLGKYFGVAYDLLPITKEGFIDLEALKSIKWEDYVMVICEHGNSELGHVQGVTKIGKLIDKYFDTFSSDKSNDLGKNPKRDELLFIVDTAASIVSEMVSLEHQKCDMLFFSGEKIGGPGGVGCLVKGSWVQLSPLVGGSHEFGNRGGTENILGIVGLHQALNIRSQKREMLREPWKIWHQQLRKHLQCSPQSLIVTTPEKDFLPHIIHFIHPDMKADLLVQKADLAGFGLSAGSACSSGTITGSGALRALGYDDEASRRGVRISWGWTTREEDLQKLIQWI